MDDFKIDFTDIDKTLSEVSDFSKLDEILSEMLDFSKLDKLLNETDFSQLDEELKQIFDEDFNKKIKELSLSSNSRDHKKEI